MFILLEINKYIVQKYVYAVDTFSIYSAGPYTH